MKNICVSLTKSINKGHRFIQSTGKPMNGMVTMTSLLATNQYFNKDLGAAKWRKEKRTWNVNWEETDGVKTVSKPINYNIISSFIREKQHFDALAFDLP